MERGLATAAAASRYTFSGIAVYRPEFFAGCTDGVFPLKPLLLRSMAAQRCTAEIYSGRWEDVGTPQRLAALPRPGRELEWGRKSQRKAPTEPAEPERRIRSSRVGARAARLRQSQVMDSPRDR